MGITCDACNITANPAAELLVIFGSNKLIANTQKAWYVPTNPGEAGIIIPSDYAMLMHFVGGDAIPHFEVEMDSLSGEQGEIGTTSLTRFERLL